MQRVALIDNYDSFTFNLVHYLGELGRRRGGMAERPDQRRGDSGSRSRTRSFFRPDRARPTRRASVSTSCGRRAKPRRSWAFASATRRSGRLSAARSCARPFRCTAKFRASSTTRRGFSGGSTAPSRRPAIIRWSSIARLPRRTRGERRNGRRAHHGSRASRPARLWRAVPSRKHRERARTPDLAQFPRLGRRFSCARARSLERSGVMEFFKPLIAKVAAGATLSRTEVDGGVRRDAVGRSDPLANGRLPDGPQGARRERRRDYRRGVNNAGQNDPGSRRLPTRSTSSEPAATIRAPTTSRRLPRSSRRRVGFLSPSTAIARPPRAPAPPTRLSRSESRSGFRLRASSAA